MYVYSANTSNQFVRFIIKCVRIVNFFFFGVSRTDVYYGTVKVVGDKPIKTAICFMIVLKDSQCGCIVKKNMIFLLFSCGNNQYANNDEKNDNDNKARNVNEIYTYIWKSVCGSTWNHLNCKHMVHICLFIGKYNEWFYCNCILFVLIYA